MSNPIIWLKSNPFFLSFWILPHPPSHKFSSAVFTKRRNKDQLSWTNLGMKVEWGQDPWLILLCTSHGKYCPRLNHVGFNSAKLSRYSDKKWKFQQAVLFISCLQKHSFVYWNNEVGISMSLSGPMGYGFLDG